MRGIPSHPDKLSARVEGDIEDVDGVMIITQIRVSYHIRLPAGKKAEAERALSAHERGCPAAMSVRDSIQISWSAELEEH